MAARPLKQLHTKQTSQVKPIRQVSTSRCIGIVGRPGSDPNLLYHPNDVCYTEDDLDEPFILVADSENHRVKIINYTTLDCVATIGEANEDESCGGVPALENPSSVCVQPHTNHIVVCDTKIPTIKIFGDLASHIGGSHTCEFKSKDTQKDDFRQSLASRSPWIAQFEHLHNPGFLCCQSNGNICVPEVSKSVVKIFDPAGRPLRTFGGRGKTIKKLQTPVGLCTAGHRLLSAANTIVGGPSMLLVADAGNKRIAKWAADGSQPIGFIQTASKGFLSQICVDLSGYICASFGGEISTFNLVQVIDPRNGEVIQKIGGESFNDPYDDVELMPGQFRPPLPPGLFKYPQGLCVDASNALMVTDVHHRVQFFDII